MPTQQAGPVCTGGGLGPEELASFQVALRDFEGVARELEAVLRSRAAYRCGYDCRGWVWPQAVKAWGTASGGRQAATDILRLAFGGGQRKKAQRCAQVMITNQCNRAPPGRRGAGGVSCFASVTPSMARQCRCAAGR